MAKQDGFGHENPYEGQSNDWITPKWIIDAFDKYAQDNLGYGCYFDLDPCASVTQPWNCARKSFTIEQDGLKQAWWGNVYCNPPYGPHTEKWVKKLADYGQGIALIFARVETKLWQDFIIPSASGYLFPRGRICFARPDGTTPKQSSGAPSALIAWGSDNRDCLIEMVDSGMIPGAFFEMAFYTGSRHWSVKENEPEIRAGEDQSTRSDESGEEPASSQYTLKFFQRDIKERMRR